MDCHHLLRYALSERSCSHHLVTRMTIRLNFCFGYLLFRSILRYNGRSTAAFIGPSRSMCCEVWLLLLFLGHLDIPFHGHSKCDIPTPTSVSQFLVDGYNGQRVLNLFQKVFTNVLKNVGRWCGLVFSSSLLLTRNSHRPDWVNKPGLMKK